MVTITRKSLSTLLLDQTQQQNQRNNASDSLCSSGLALKTTHFSSGRETKAPNDPLGCRFPKPTERQDDKDDVNDTKCNDKPMNGLETVSLDVWIHIILFLTVPETRTLRHVNTRFRNLLDLAPASSSDDKHNRDRKDTVETLQYLWQEHARRMWPHPHHLLSTAVTRRITFDTTVAASSLAQLLTLARPVPWCMQVAHEGEWIRTVQVVPANKNEEDHNCLGEESGNQNDHPYHRDYIQYTGRIGHGNRCVRANVPFPQPIVCLDRQSNDSNNNNNNMANNNPTTAATKQEKSSYSFWSLQSLLARPASTSTRCVCSHCKRLRQSHRTRRPPPFSFLVGRSVGGLASRRSLDDLSIGSFPGSALSSSGGWLRPFCIPQVQGNGSVMISPRLVAYFEVTIRRAPAAAAADDDVSSQQEQPFRSHATTTAWDETFPAEMRPSRHPSTGRMQQQQLQQQLLHPQIESEIDCIAIGICTRSFRWDCRMPGWDAQSIGYHSDDGALFHGSGRSIRPHYGPRYGPGDVVGCGVDYARRIVFFTYNGRNLGTAKQFEDHWYPKPTSSWWQQPSSPPSQPHEWFPVVGLDSNHLVHCNFSGPFAFDLEAYQQQQNHADVLKQALVMTRTPLSNAAVPPVPTTTETCNVEKAKKIRFRRAVRS